MSDARTTLETLALLGFLFRTGGQTMNVDRMSDEEFEALWDYPMHPRIGDEARRARAAEQRWQEQTEESDLVNTGRREENERLQAEVERLRPLAQLWEWWCGLWSDGDTCTSRLVWTSDVSPRWQRTYYVHRHGQIVAEGDTPAAAVRAAAERLGWMAESEVEK